MDAAVKLTEEDADSVLPYIEEPEEVVGRRVYFGRGDTAERYVPTTHRALQKARRDADDIRDQAQGELLAAGHVEMGTAESKRAALYTAGIIDEEGRLTEYGRDLNERIQKHNLDASIEKDGEVPDSETYRELDEDYGKVTDNEKSIAEAWRKIDDRLFGDMVEKGLIDPSKYRTNHIAFVFDESLDPTLVKRMMWSETQNEIVNVYGRRRMSELRAADLDFVKSARAYIPAVSKQIAYEPKLRGLMELGEDGEKVIGGQIYRQFLKDKEEIGEEEATKRLKYAKDYIHQQVSVDPDSGWDAMERWLADQDGPDGLLAKFRHAKMATALSVAQSMIARHTLGGNAGSAIRNFIGGQLNIVMRSFGGYESTFDSLVYAVPDYIRSVVNYATSPQFRAMAQKEGVTREADKFLSRFLGAGQFSKAIKKMDEVLFYPFRFMERMNRGIAFHMGIVRSLRNQGVTPSVFSKVPEDAMRKAITEGHRLADETQFLYGAAHRSPYAKAHPILYQYIEFPIEQGKLVADSFLDFLQGARTGDAKKMAGFLSYAMMLGSLSYVFQSMGLSPTFMWDSAAAGLLKPFSPMIGIDIESGQKGVLPTSPMAEFIMKLGSGKHEEAVKELLGWIIPAGAQINNLLKAREAHRFNGSTFEYAMEPIGGKVYNKLVGRKSYRVVHGDRNQPPLTMGEMLAMSLGMQLQRDREVSQMGMEIDKHREAAKWERLRTNPGTESKATRIWKSAPRDIRFGNRVVDDGLTE